MSVSKILVMPNRPANHDAAPDSLTAVWRMVHALEADVKGLKEISVKPSLWRRMWIERNFLVGLAAIVVVLALAAASSLYYVAGLVMDVHIQAAITPLQNDVKSIAGDVRDLKTTLRDIQIKQTAIDPTSQQNVKQLKQLVDAAKLGPSPISDDTIKAVGASFLAAAKTNTVAWDGVLQLVNYRSYLNSFNKSDALTSRGIAVTYYVPRVPPGYLLPAFSVYGAIPPENAARFNAIGEGLLSGNGRGNEYIYAHGGGLILDGYELKNVVLTNVHIVYNGGPLQMENVHFINCTFEVAQQRNGPEVATAILNNPSVGLTVS